MQHYSLHVELDVRDAPDDFLLSLQEQLEAAEVHPSVGHSPRGFASAQISVPGENLLGATIAAVGILRNFTSAEPVAIEAMTEAEFEARQGYVELPDLVSVPDAAAMLGLTRQRILQMIEAHAFPSARKIGKGYVIAVDDVSAKTNTQYSAVLPDGYTHEDVARLQSRKGREIKISTPGHLTITKSTDVKAAES